MKSSDSVGGEYLQTVRQLHLTYTKMITMRIQPQGDTVLLINKISLPFVFGNYTLFFYETISSQNIYLVFPCILLQADLLQLLVPHHIVSVGVGDIDVMERGKSHQSCFFISL